MKLAAELRRDEIRGAATGEPFVLRADRSIIHLASIISDAERSSLGGADLVYFQGRFPDWVAHAANRDEPCVEVFVEIGVDRFVYLGLGRLIALRFKDGQPELLGLQTEVGLPEEWLAKIAPDLLHPAEDRSASADVFVELTSSADGWRAVVAGTDVDMRGPTFGDALSWAESAAANEVLARLAEGRELAVAMPNVVGLRWIPSGHPWPMDAIAKARRVVVRVNVYSADLTVSGWAMSRDELWFG